MLDYNKYNGTHDQSHLISGDRGSGDRGRGDRGSGDRAPNQLFTLY